MNGKKPKISIFISSLTAEFASKDGLENERWGNWSWDWNQSTGPTWCDYQWHGPYSDSKCQSYEKNTPISSFILREEVFGALAYHPRCPVFRLNQIGALCFKLLQSNQALQEIVNELELENEDISDFISQLESYGLCLN